MLLASTSTPNVDQIVWDSLTEDEKKRAIDFVPMYIEQTPNSSGQFYLNQYLKAKPWENHG